MIHAAGRVYALYRFPLQLAIQTATSLRIERQEHLFDFISIQTPIEELLNVRRACFILSAYVD
jgi:hypothetical protein